MMVKPIAILVRSLNMKYEVFSFEEELSRIDEINIKLSAGNVTLEESVLLYEEASERIQHCKKLLNDAELKITALSSNLDS